MTRPRGSCNLLQLKRDDRADHQPRTAADKITRNAWQAISQSKVCENGEATPPNPCPLGVQTPICPSMRNLATLFPWTTGKGSYAGVACARRSQTAEWLLSSLGWSWTKRDTTLDRRIRRLCVGGPVMPWQQLFKDDQSRTHNGHHETFGVGLPKDTEVHLHPFTTLSHFCVPGGTSASYSTCASGNACPSLQTGESQSSLAAAWFNNRIPKIAPYSVSKQIVQGIS
ncbi:hypothetical protein B0H66DRAFT_336659 [Apodospora peruviana]|uniref:Uncharacterized protein n=1 Tax=Apodospora peruviana TaxID=516989 RepID=A0AAE0M0Z6_9PEZI|nr:hypothetical protein B0H66DRAFT_336659 [Apodospora peruviana]